MNSFIPIQGYEGIYEINIDGIIRSIDRTILNNKSIISRLKGKIIKPFINNVSYPSVVLYKQGKVKSFTIHRLIAIHFIPNPENKSEVNHKNGIKSDFSIQNLEWCTSKENSRHAVETGLFVPKKGKESHSYGRRGELHPSFGLRGDKSPLARLVLDTETGIFYYGTREAGEAKNIYPSTLRNMLNGTKKNKTSLQYV